jgi:hypothetical protein
MKKWADWLRARPADFVAAFRVVRIAAVIEAGGITSFYRPLRASLRPSSVSAALRSRGLLP